MNETELFAKALSYAAEKHAKQTRQDGSPYIWHPLGVAKLIKDAGYGIPYQIAALLHDTLEDTDATEEEIAMFGEDVLRAVRLLTKREGLSIAAYVKGVQSDEMASAVKSCDIIYNCNDAKNADVAWARRYLLKSKEHYYGHFSAVADRALCKALAEVDQKWREAQARQRKIEQYGETPDLTRKDARFFYHDLVNAYFCYFDSPGELWHSWVLTKNGWQFVDDNLLFGTHAPYSDECLEATLEEVQKQVELFGL